MTRNHGSPAPASAGVEKESSEFSEASVGAVSTMRACERLFHSTSSHACHVRLSEEAGAGRGGDGGACEQPWKKGNRAESGTHGTGQLTGEALPFNREACPLHPEHASARALIFTMAR